MFVEPHKESGVAWIVSLTSDFRVVSRTTQNSFPPSWRRSTSKARLSHLTEALSRALRRRLCRIMFYYAHVSVHIDELCLVSTVVVLLTTQCDTSHLAAMRSDRWCLLICNNDRVRPPCLAPKLLHASIQGRY